MKAKWYKLKQKEIIALLKKLNINYPNKVKKLQIAAIIQHPFANIQRLSSTQSQETNKNVVSVVYWIGLKSAVSNVFAFCSYVVICLMSEKEWKICFQPYGGDRPVKPSFKKQSCGGAHQNHINNGNERNWSREKKSLEMMLVSRF